MAQVQVRAPSPAQRLNGSKARYLNQELSRVDYAGRLLARAEDRSLPLLERVRFLAFSSEFLDDLFQIRVAGLREQLEVDPDLVSPDGLTPLGQLLAIRAAVLPLVRRQTHLFAADLGPGLAEAGMRIVPADSLSKPDAHHLSEVFQTQIFPVLTPLAVDPAHPFPYISHRSLNLAVLVQDPLRRQRRFARIKVPPLLPRFVALPDGRGYVPLEQVIASHLQALFPGMAIIGEHPFRVTRDADLDVIDSEADDLLAAIQSQLRRQSRAARAVRLEVEPGMTAEVQQLLMRELELEERDVYTVDGLLDLESLKVFCDADRPDLKLERWVPTTHPRLINPAREGMGLFDTLRAGAVLVHHPYDSFASSVEAFIAQAALDPQVLAIKQTLYRTSGPASPIARALIDAAEAGKQVVALVELKARGDEQANIVWAQALEKSGVHVVYGLVGLKTHAKISLVVRQEPDGIRHYVHVGTGNYNPSTAQAYEDVGLLSADPDIGADVVELFNFLTGYSRQRKYRKLLVAPTGLRGGILKLINREAKPSGRIIIKVNNLVDPEVVEALYEAARAGSEIDLIVRTASSLRPGVKKLSESIRVRSIIGHFLEHSRIFRFGADPKSADYYIGSADMMERNLDRRVEALVPITDTGLRMLVEEILQVELADDVLAWELRHGGEWTRVPTTTRLNSQQRFMELALSRARTN